MPMEVDYLPAAFIGTVMMAYAHSLSQTGLYVAAGWSTEIACLVKVKRLKSQ